MYAWYDTALYFLSEAAADPINFGILAQYGLLGFVAAGAIVFGRVSYKREIDRADRLEAEVTRLNNLIIERAIPALTSAAQAADAATRLLRDMQRAQEIDLLRAPTSRRPRAGGDDR
jgi:hypothetical protein